MSNARLHPGTIDSIVSAIRTRRLRARELVLDCYRRIDAHDGILHGFISLRRDDALAEADAIDHAAAMGADLPPLAGIPISVKDVIDVAGVPTTAASRSQEGIVPDRDAAVVAQLRRAGAIVIGKANCHELSFGGPSFDLPFPPARNPWDPNLFPGGSSSGSGVTVASGMCLGSIGTDTAGSVRLPAALCGIVGLKPTFGACSLDGVRPLSASMDHCGPLASCAADAKSLFSAMRRSDTAIERSPARAKAVAAGDFRGLRIGIPRESWGLGRWLHSDLAGAYDQALTLFSREGAKLVELDLPALEDLHACASIIMMAEVTRQWGAEVRRHPERFGRMFRGRALVGEALPAGAYHLACETRHALSRRLSDAIGTTDGLLIPGAFTPAMKLQDVHAFYFLREPILNIIANLGGLPAVAFPSGLFHVGLPVGLQLVGSHGFEDRLLDVVSGFETIQPGSRVAPALASTASRAG